MVGWFKEWKQDFWKTKKLILLSFLFLCLAIFIYTLSANYSNKVNAISVPDLILDNTPTINLGFIYVFSILIITLTIFVYPLIFKIKYLPYVIAQFSLLSILRSFFIALTHLNIPQNAAIYSAPAWFGLIDPQNALFFSGHVAFSFLGFLLFRKEKISIFFLLATVLLGIVVLLMHVHYSIDVFAALFIAYGSYKLGNYFMKLKP